ncbi:MAG: ATP-grasp domain-containing protein [Bacteroides sp.]|nr:ATP-grasp domain-containing protein [Bacteroides sp.]
MNILVTAIGSFSAMCVINSLKEKGHRVIGCDIYPGGWHAETSRCDGFYQAPFATKKEEYIKFLLETTKAEDINMIIPLTDLEIDVLNKARTCFDDINVILAMPSEKTLEIARDKYKLFLQFADDIEIPSVPTFKVGTDNIPKDIIPCIAKPYNGRSSEGLKKIQSLEELVTVNNNPQYIIQRMVDGPVFTVDYVRNSQSGLSFSVPRQELLRTKNGAGTTVRVFRDKDLMTMVDHIGKRIGINGCVNMEFIKNNGLYYLIDINPRFSAGVAFSSVAGYDMVNSHVACHIGGKICPPIKIDEQIITKTYIEEITSKQ